VSRADLEALADESRLPPSILDVFLRWIARRSGSKYLDATELQDMSGTLPLEAAMPPEWQVQVCARRTIVVSTIGSQKFLGRMPKSLQKPTLSDSVLHGLKKLKPPQTIAILKPSDGSPVDGAWVTIKANKGVQIKYLTPTKIECKALGEALTTAELKRGKFTYGPARAGVANEWSLLAKVVTHIFSATSATASSETLSKLLHFPLVHLILKVIETGASQDPEVESSLATVTDGHDNGGTGGGSFHDNNSQSNNNNGDKGGDKGLKAAAAATAGSKRVRMVRPLQA
jgi:hypothetical protein